MGRFQYDPKLHRYRNLDTGRIVSTATMRSWRDKFIREQTDTVNNLVNSLADGHISLQTFEREMRTRIRTAYSTEYIFGRGGVASMAQADRGRLGGILNEQYRFLRGFIEMLRDGDVTPEYARNRAGLYIQSATQAHERGKAAAHGDLNLPAYPGDGSTECLSRCRCTWRITEKDTQWNATWVLNASVETCATCSSRAGEWSPLVIAKEASDG